MLTPPHPGVQHRWTLQGWWLPISGEIVTLAPCHLVNQRPSLFLPAPPSQVPILISLVSSPSDTTGSPTPPAPTKTRVRPGAPPTPPWQAPMYQDTMDSVLHLAWLSHRTVAHLAPPILWTAILVFVGQMASLSVQLLSVDHQPPQPHQQPPPPPPPPPQPQPPPPPPPPPPAPQAQCPLLTATPVCAAPWVRRCAPPPPAPPPPLCPPAPPCLAQTLPVSVSSPSPSLV